MDTHTCFYNNVCDHSRNIWMFTYSQTPKGVQTGRPSMRGGGNRKKREQRGREERREEEEKGGKRQR